MDFQLMSKGTNRSYLVVLTFLEDAENYVDVAVITLNIEAAPEHVRFSET